MSNIISVHYLLQFLIFICIIPVHTIAQTKLKIAFVNGLNVIRCSDKQVQVYLPNDDSELFLSNILTCDNKKDIFDTNYARFTWTELKIICSSDTEEVHEELFIKKTAGVNGIDKLPDVKGQLCQSTDSYEFEIEYDVDDDIDKISSKDQPANDAYFNKKTNSKEKRIYISFPDHPIICRLIFTGDNDNPCPSMNDQNVANVDYACYYNPSADETPTMAEMEAELKQVKEATKPDNTEAYLLELEKPDTIPSDPCDSESNQPQPHKPSGGSSNNKKVVHPKSPKPKAKKSIPKIVGFILGILLLIALIGGIGFYMIQKHRLNNSPSSSANIENGGNKGLSSRIANQSQQSLATTTANDANTELSMNISSKKEKPTVELQASKGNKKQRTGASMVFNEDM